MPRRKKPGPANPSSTQPFNNPFSSLAGIRQNLPNPEGPPTVHDHETVLGVDGLKNCGRLVLQRERKGHGGKTVTRLRGLPPGLVPALRPVLKRSLGCGASVMDGQLVLHGDLGERAARWLREHGAREVITEGARVTAKRAVRQVRPPGSGTQRADIRPGGLVDIVLKKDQRSGTLSRGTVAELLTRSATHPHGIKVRLEDGRVGRVKRILD